MNKLSKHHVVPTSRLCVDCKKKEAQIAIIPHEIHKNIHFIFGNMAPEEIIRYLVNQCWGGKWKYVTNALAHRRNSA